MDNKQVRQISPEEVQSRLSIDEKQKTQVLNLQEVQKAIRFEKLSSKKPALLVALFGIALLIFGGSLQITTILGSKKVEKRNIGKDIVEDNTKKLSCTKTTLNNPDGTDVTYKVDYEFKNSKLNKVTKVYNKSAIPGNTQGTATISNYIKEIQTLLNTSDGYNVSMVNNGDNSLGVQTEINYEYFDMTKLKEIQQTKYFTKVDYQRNDNYATITSEMLNDGFTCE